jgi:SOS response regulatory protein OraA/RecX
VEDARVAQARAEQLAARGSGDALIRDDLERRGIDAETIEDALGGLEPERERAARIVAERGRSPRTARYLASRGFGEDVLAPLIAPED